MSLIRRLAALLLGLLLAAGASAQAAPLVGYQVVKTFPHDRAAFTEGLFYQDGQLFESTGLEGHSTIRRVALATGKVLQERMLEPRYFGEGIISWKDRLIQLTWRTEVGFVYDLKTFKPRSQFTYPGEGWALTQDGRRLIMSDGTDELRFLDPETLRETGRLRVTDGGYPLGRLNELEYVRGHILANVWLTDRIAIIDPASGHVTGMIDLSRLLGQPHGTGVKGQPDVLNGIAYDAKGDRLFVTGKNWPKVYQIKLLWRG